MITLLPYRPAIAPDLLAVWHAALGAVYPIMPDLWDGVTAGDPSFRSEDGIVAMRGDRPVGFVLAKRFRETYPGCEQFAGIGYVTMLAVHPDHQRQGIGTLLLRAAEARFRAEGASKVILGGSFHHVFPGIPAFFPGSDADDAALRFFETHGYARGKEVWDVRRNLAGPPNLPVVGALREGVELRPMRPEEAPLMLAFLNRDFAGRWPRDVAHHLAHGGPAAHVFGLFVGEEPQGFALLHPPHAPNALRWSGFAAGIAALGPIGVSPVLRGQGFGLSLLVRALEQLREWGASDTVIDWTDLLDFYSRCGFRPWLRYRLAQKDL